MNEDLTRCEDCGRPFRADILEHCPGCGADNGPVIEPVGGLGVVSEEEATQETIWAINRVTHAIRSIALFIFISLSTSVLGYAIVGAGASSVVSCSLSGENCGNTGLVNFGWLVIALGFIAALVAGISELRASKP